MRNRSNEAVPDPCVPLACRHTTRASSFSSHSRIKEHRDRMVSIGIISADRGHSHWHSKKRTRASPPNRCDGKDDAKDGVRDDVGDVPGDVPGTGTEQKSVAVRGGGVAPTTTRSTESGADALCVSSKNSLASRRLRSYPG